MSAEHALHVLTSLPLRVELVFAFGVSGTLSLIVCPQILQAAQAHQFEWCFHQFGGEIHKFVGGSAKLAMCKAWGVLASRAAAAVNAAVSSMAVKSMCQSGSCQ